MRSAKEQNAFQLSSLEPENLGTSFPGALEAGHSQDAVLSEPKICTGGVPAVYEVK